MTGPVAAGASEFEAKVASFVKENRLYGAAAGVVHDGELVWSGGAGFADLAAGRSSGPDVLYRIASITKTFTGTAIMQLRDAGKLDLDDAAVTWLPELAGSASPATIGAVTIRRLLSHESGLLGDPPGTDFTAAVPVYEGSAEATLARVAEIFTAVPPNTQTKYCNLGYQLLGEIVRRASGVPYPQYVTEQILQPLRMSSTSFEPLDPALAGRCAVGYRGRSFSDELGIASQMPLLWAEGGLWSTVEDLARWVTFQLGAYADEPDKSAVLRAASRKEMHTPRYLSDEEWTGAFGISWAAARDDDVIWINHSGGLPGFTSNACFDRKSKVGAIALVNGVSDASSLSTALGGIARRLVAAAAPQIAPPAPAPAEVTELLGLYAPPDLSYLVRLEWRDGKLAAVDPDAPADALTLEPDGEPGTFVVAPGVRASGETLRVVRLADGRIASLRLGPVSFVRLDPVGE
jgi:CubicO group peptidase (beta-lactamase class C family)